MKEVNAITKPWTGLSTATIIFTGLVCLWTLSHNLDLYDSGLSQRGRVIGRVGCLAAEAFVFWSVYQHLKYGGARGRAAKHASFAMLAVLLINTIIASLKAQGKALGMGSLLDMYSQYGVPVAFSFVIVWGLHHILSHDPDSRENDLRADEQELGRTVKMDTQQRLHQSVQSKLQDDSVKQVIEAAATQLVARIVTEATSQIAKPGLLSGRKYESTPLLEAEPVGEIDESKLGAQYVNGEAKADPKQKPRRSWI